MGQRSSIYCLPSSSIHLFLPLCKSPQDFWVSLIWENLSPGATVPLLFAPALPTRSTKRRRIPQEAGRGIGSPWELGPSQRRQRRLCTPQERAADSLWLVGWGCVRGGALDERAHSLCLDSVPDSAGPLHAFSFNLQKKASRCYLHAHLTEEETEADAEASKMKLWAHLVSRTSTLLFTHRHFLINSSPAQAPSLIR